MKSLARSTFVRTLLLLGAAAAPALLTPSAAVAQSQTRIAVVNPAKIFNEMAETKALQGKMAEDQKKFETESKAKAAGLTELKKSRDESYKPGTQQWKDANAALIKATAEFKIWAQGQQAQAEWNQKEQMKSLFDKIQVTIAKVAQRDGIDLVIADSSEKLPDEIDNVDIRALRGLILQKNVLFVSPTKQGLDITAAVLLQLDADFKAGGPAATGK